MPMAILCNSQFSSTVHQFVHVICSIGKLSFSLVTPYPAKYLNSTQQLPCTWFCASQPLVLTICLTISAYLWSAYPGPSPRCWSPLTSALNDPGRWAIVTRVGPLSFIRVKQRICGSHFLQKYSYFILCFHFVFNSELSRFLSLQIEIDSSYEAGAIGSLLEQVSKEQNQATSSVKLSQLSHFAAGAVNLTGQ